MTSKPAQKNGQMTQIDIFPKKTYTDICQQVNTKILNIASDEMKSKTTIRYHHS